MKRKKNPLTKLMNLADALLQKVNRLKHKKCEACGKPTQVGHHWIEKSRSKNLRYNLENIIPLCNSCHSKIHNIFGNSVVGGLDVAETIINKRGRAWKEKMDKEAVKIIKVDRFYYEEAINRLSRLLEELSTG